tara:strand:- start:17345 stop:17644 length:300 start_codon:yes stop_codon:yes gene_type:complete
MEYYNTTNVSQRQLTLFTEKAKNQSSRILKIFIAFPDKAISASDIVHNGILDEAPITSVRRSLNTLKKRLEIVPFAQKEGLYGRPETTYKLNPDTITKE